MLSPFELSGPGDATTAPASPRRVMGAPKAPDRENFAPA
jgi:hypothetical protein